jgi:hypothetical protein
MRSTDHDPAPRLASSASLRMPELQAGEVVGGRYQVLRLLGKGGMGTVYAVADPLHGEVALKVVSGELYAGPEGRLRFKREFHTMALLRHPNTLAVHELGELSTSHGPALGYSMELFPGRDLDRVEQLSMTAIGHVLVEVARALGFIHNRGHVHRDLKPQNVRLGPGDPDRVPGPALKLMDFGLMEPIGARSRGDLYGTPSFVAPEVVRGAAMDGRADLFALGALAYWLLTGQRPFASESIIASAKMAETPPPPPSQLAEPGTLPPALDQLVLELCAANPAERPACAEEVIARLAPIFGTSVNLDAAARKSYLVASRPVGREAELAALSQLLHGARQGQGGAMLLVAPAGLGKSRLLEAFALQARLEGFKVAQTSAHEGGHAPFETLQRAMQPLVVGSATPGAPRPSPQPAATAAPARARHLRMLLAMVTRLADEQPLCLIIDELPRADTASIEALAALAGAAPSLRLAVVAGGRSDEVLAQSGAALSAWADVPRLELTAFGAAQVEQLVQALFGRIEVPPTFVRDLHAQGGGNPYHLTELLRTLVDDGVIGQVAGRFVLPAALDRPDGTALPSGLDAALLRRVERQGPEARRLIEALAVLDRRVTLPLLVSVAEGDGPVPDGHEQEVFAALDALLAAGILEQHRGEDDGGQARYGFHHPRLREVLYRQLEPSLRGLLHRRAVRTLVRLHGPKQDEHAAEIGHHLARSPGPEEQRQGARLLLAAGRAHFDSEAYADAVGPHREALAILEQSLAEGAALSVAERAELEAARLEAWERLARIGLYYDFALGEDFLARLYRHHRASAGLRGDGDAEREARRATGRPRLEGAAASVRAGLQRGRLLAGALGRYARSALAERSGRQQGDSQRAALEPLARFFLTTAYRCTVLADLGRMNDALDLAEELRPLVLSPRRVEAGAYQLSRVTALIHQGRFGLAMQACLAADTGLAEQRAGLDSYDRAMGEAGVLFSRAVTLAFRGHPAWQAEHARLLEAADRFDLDFARMTARVVMAVASSVRGDRHAAQETLHAYLAHYRTLGRAAHAYRVYPWMALVELEAGQLAAARGHLETFRQGAPAGYFADGMGSYLEGEMLLAVGDPAAAEAALERALRWAREPSADSVFLGSRARLAMGEAALALGRPAAAATHSAAVLEAAGAASSRCERDRVRARRLLGKARAADGDTESARSQLQAALQLCHAVDSPLEWALTHAARATLASEMGASSDEAVHRREAERHFQALGNDIAARRLRTRPAPGSTAASVPDRADRADRLDAVDDEVAVPVSSDATRPDRPVRRSR